MSSRYLNFSPFPLPLPGWGTSCLLSGSLHYLCSFSFCLPGLPFSTPASILLLEGAADLVDPIMLLSGSNAADGPLLLSNILKEFSLLYLDTCPNIHTEWSSFFPLLHFKPQDQHSYLKISVKMPYSFLPLSLCTCCSTCLESVSLFVSQALCSCLTF